MSSASDRSQMVYGFVLINMKKSIMPYSNKSNPLISSGAVAGAMTVAGSYPAPLQATRVEVTRQMEAFAETINKAGSAKDLGPAFGTASEIGKRNTMFDNLEKALEGYTQQLINYASYSWNPPAELQYATGVDKAVDALMASCIPMEDARTLGDVERVKRAGAAGIKVSPTTPTSLCAYYYYWTNCLGDNRGGSNGGAPNHAIADWRYELASMHFNMAVIYLSCAAHLSFVCGAVSYPQYFSNEHASAARLYANTNQTSLMEKECYAYCCTAAFHYEKAASYMKEVLGGNADGTAITGSTAGTAPANAPSAAGSGSGSPNDSTSGGGAGTFSSHGKGSASSDPTHSVDVNDQILVAGGVDKTHVPVDMSLPFLALMREVMIGQGQEISIAKAFKAGKEDNSVSKMTFTSITGRLLLGAKNTFANAEVLTQRELVVMRSGFSSFIASIQTKAAGYEAIAYAVQGAYMAVPITSSQRMEMAILERERAASGNGNASSAAAAIGEDAGMNPEDGIWCLNKAAELAQPLPERAAKSGCAPAVRTWLTFVIQRYITEVQANITELQRMGLSRKGSAGPVSLKSGMIVARPKAFQKVPEK